MAQRWRRTHHDRYTPRLNLDSLIDEINTNQEGETNNNIEAFPTGARIGHIHLKVTNLERSMKFYHEKLGLDITSIGGL